MAEITASAINQKVRYIWLTSTRKGTLVAEYIYGDSNRLLPVPAISYS